MLTAYCIIILMFLSWAFGIVVDIDIRYVAAIDLFSLLFVLGEQ